MSGYNNFQNTDTSNAWMGNSVEQLLNVENISSSADEVSRDKDYVFEGQSSSESDSTESRKIEVIELEKPENSRASNTTQRKKLSGCKKPGRKQSSVWDEFITKRANGKITSNVCSRCKMEVSAKAPRMKAHLKNCNKVLASTAGAPVQLLSSPESSSLKSSLPIKQQQGITKFVSKVSKVGQQKLDFELAQSIFSANLPFSFVDNMYFKKFLNSLNPAYSVPSRKLLAGRLLEEQFAATQHTMKDYIKGKNVTLSQDGWSTNQNDQLICHGLKYGKKTFFLNAVSPGTNTKSSEYCLSLIEDAISISEKKYECHVTSIVTDNCSVMELMRKKLRNSSPDLHVYGCNAHLLNLVGKHYTPADLQAKVATVHNYMRNHHFTAASLKELKVNRPVLAGETRWNSQLDMFNSYVNNHTDYLRVIRKFTATQKRNSKEQAKDLEISNILNDPTVYERLAKDIKLLFPIAVWLDKVK